VDTPTSNRTKSPSFSIFKIPAVVVGGSSAARGYVSDSLPSKGLPCQGCQDSHNPSVTGPILPHWGTSPGEPAHPGSSLSLGHNTPLQRNPCGRPEPAKARFADRIQAPQRRTSPAHHLSVFRGSYSCRLLWDRGGDRLAQVFRDRFSGISRASSGPRPRRCRDLGGC